MASRSAGLEESVDLRVATNLRYSSAVKERQKNDEEINSHLPASFLSILGARSKRRRCWDGGDASVVVKRKVAGERNSRGEADTTPNPSDTSPKISVTGVLDVRGDERHNELQEESDDQQLHVRKKKHPVEDNTCTNTKTAPRARCYSLVAQDSRTDLGTRETSQIDVADLSGGAAESLPVDPRER